MPSAGGTQWYQTLWREAKTSSPSSVVAPLAVSPLREPEAPESETASAKLSLAGDSRHSRNATPDLPRKPSMAMWYVVPATVAKLTLLPPPKPATSSLEAIGVSAFTALPV